MRQIATAVCLLCVLSFPIRRADAQGPGDRAPELVAPTEALTPEQERALFRLPPGFEAQLVASEPDIAKPLNLAFDDLGRLWVTSSYEYPWPVEAGKPARDKVTVLSEFAPDGRAQKVEPFAEGLNIPIGVLPLSPRSALVHSIPNIYHMVDGDGDGRADHQDLFYGSIGFRDTHGMASAFTWGFDGWIYACHGFANDSTLKGRDGQGIVMNSGNTYRLKPNGMHVEQFTWGQVNPFGLTFDPIGNMYSTDCHTKPIYLLLRGAYYDSFGKPHDGLGYGPDMMNHDHASTGIAGICYYAADAFPKAYQDTIFVGNVVTSRINRDRLEWRGSSPWAIAEDDFLKSDDPWFRPVDIELGPDGNLYIADFYNCIIGHYEVDLKHPRRDRERGRIWRIVYRGEDAKATPAPRDGNLTASHQDELVASLAHPNLSVRIHAANVLVERGLEMAEPVANAVARTESPLTALHGMWVLERLFSLPDSILLGLANSEHAVVRTHVMRLLSERPSWNDTARVIARKGLWDRDPTVRRCAADAAGRHPSAENVLELVKLLTETDPVDTHLRHTLRMALRDQFRDGAGYQVSLHTESDRNRIGAFELTTIADVMPGVHTPESARWLLGYLKKGIKDTPPNILRYEHTIARYGDDALVRDLVEYACASIPAQTVSQSAQLRAIHRGLQERGGPLPGNARAWAIEIAAALLGAEDSETRIDGTELAGEFRLVELKDALADRSRDHAAPTEERIRAFQSIVTISVDDAVAPLGDVLTDADAPIELRTQAANMLGQSGRAAARERLVDALPKVPTRLHLSIAASMAVDRAGAQALLKALREGKASPLLLQEASVASRLSVANPPDLARQLEELTAGLPPTDTAASELIQKRLAGYGNANREVERGAVVFKKNCAVCHQIGGDGAKVGPQLDGVGARGVERLIEDILDPNRNVDQAFRATTLALADGRVLTGLVVRDPGEVIVLADQEGKELTIEKGTVEERSVVPLSPMPANLRDQIEEADFYDLVEFLLAQRQAAEAANDATQR